MDDVDAVIGRLQPAEFLDVVSEVQRLAFTGAAWSDDDNMDVDFRTMCRMLQELELFLTVRQAVKPNPNPLFPTWHSDWSVLERPGVIDPGVHLLALERPGVILQVDCIRQRVMNSVLTYHRVTRRARSLHPL